MIRFTALHSGLRLHSPQAFMANARKNKTLAVFLAAVLGGAGIHRFYLRGKRDAWGWLHLAGLASTLAGFTLFHQGDPVATLLCSLPLTFSALAAALQALLLGLTPDPKWDMIYNPGSQAETQSNWILALLLVLTLAGGMFGVLWTISRSLDLFITGGSYG
jgi:TM2 domain-containing membrane protein YozV